MKWDRKLRIPPRLGRKSSRVEGGAFGLITLLFRYHCPPNRRPLELGGMDRINRRPKALVFVIGLVALLARGSGAQEQAEWRIAPEKINIQAGSTRILQILDNRAQELHGALWSVDKPELAEIREEEGRPVVDAK